MRSPLNNPLMGDGFGYRMLKGQKNFHTGIDLISANGDTRVFSILPGIVVVDFDAYDPAKRFIDRAHWNGNWVGVKHVINGREVLGVYVHIGQNTVSHGQKIEEGHVLGNFADAGYSFGAHLHFGIVVNGTVVDPIPFFTAEGIEIPKRQAKK